MLLVKYLTHGFLTKTQSLIRRGLKRVSNTKISISKHIERNLKHKMLSNMMGKCNIRVKICNSAERAFLQICCLLADQKYAAAVFVKKFSGD